MPTSTSLQFCGTEKNLQEDIFAGTYFREKTFSREVIFAGRYFCVNSIFTFRENFLPRKLSVIQYLFDKTREFAV